MAKRTKTKVKVVRYCIGWNFDGLVYANHYLEEPKGQRV